MNENDDLSLLHAFVDGELDLTNRLRLEERMRSEPSLARRIEELAQLRDVIAARADYHPAPATARDRLRASMAQAAAAPAAAPTRRPRVPAGIAAALVPWLDWRALAAALGLVAVLAVGVDRFRPHADDRLLDEVVASHVRSTLGEHLVDIASSDQHTVKPWLSSKLDFSPPVGELRLAGSVFLGGRIDYLDGRPVAALVYRQGAHVVNEFVWPSATAATDPVFMEQRGYRTAHWSGHGMAHWAISDVNAEEFAGVVGAMRSVGSETPGR